MTEELKLKIEKYSSDRDFFILNRTAIFNAFDYAQKVIDKFIDICCMKFKSFQVNRTSYIYGSIVTLAYAIFVSNGKYFANAKGNAIDYMEHTFFKIFMEQFNTETLVTEKTQLHMLKGNVVEFQQSKEPLKKYLDQITIYCIDNKKEGSSKENVINELSKYIKEIFD